MRRSLWERETVHRWRLYLTEVRAPFFTATIVPVTLGGVIAWAKTGTFHWGLFLLTLFAGLCLHAGTNVANDYFDHVFGTDEINYEFVRPYTGGSRLIQKGLLSPGEVLWEALLLYAAGALAGLYLAWTRGVVILLLGLFGAASGFFYTAPPFRLAGRGIGEFFVGINFGVLMTLGAYYVQVQRLSWEPVLASLPVAFLITAVLYINQFQDAPSDAATGKRNLVVRLGKAKAVSGYIALLLLTYAAIVVSVVFRAIPPLALISLVTVPLALRAARTARAHYEDALRLAPANAITILLHLSVGLLLILGYAISGAM
jgi:1,4-dihydroxy-2-naphthoate octaprenyltransferase